MVRESYERWLAGDLDAPVGRQHATPRDRGAALPYGIGDHCIARPKTEQIVVHIRGPVDRTAIDADDAISSPEIQADDCRTWAGPHDFSAGAASGRWP